MCFFKRFSLSFVLILGTWQGIWAGEPADQTAAAAEKYQNDMIAARKQYDQAVASITADYTKILKTALTEQTQRGDLDTALMTRNKIRWLESQQAAAGNLMEKLAGTSWMNTLKVTWEWKKDGSFYRNGQPMLCIPVDAYRAVLIYSKTDMQMFIFDENFQTFAQWGKGDKDTPFTTSTRVKVGK